MSTNATGKFEPKSWDEKPYNEMEGGPTLKRASITTEYSGGVEGSGALEYLLMYRDDGSATYVGYERVTGRVGERSGSFVLEHRGVFEGGAAKATLSVIPGSATGDLSGLQGQGTFLAPGGPSGEYSLEYDFA